MNMAAEVRWLCAVALFIICINEIVANQPHKRFEYKLSFKPPYLAQRDGSVPFWEYGGSKLQVFGGLTLHAFYQMANITLTINSCCGPLPKIFVFCSFLFVGSCRNLLFPLLYRVYFNRKTLTPLARPQAVCFCSQLKFSSFLFLSRCT